VLQTTHWQNTYRSAQQLQPPGMGKTKRKSLLNKQNLNTIAMILKDTILQVKNKNNYRTEYNQMHEGYRADILLTGRDKISITALATDNFELWEINAFVTSDTTVKFRRNKSYTALSYAPNMAVFEEKPGGDTFYGYAFNLVHERTLCYDLAFSSHVPYIGFLIFINDSFLSKNNQEFGWIHRFKPDISPEKPIVASALSIPASWEITDMLMDVFEMNKGRKESPFLKTDIDYLASQTLCELDTLFRWQYVMRKYNAPLPF
jgi:hypothetical protein